MKDNLLDELRWCYADGNSGPRTKAALKAAIRELERAKPAGEAVPMQLPESMSRDEMLSYYSQYANVQANEALQYQKRIRDLEALLAAQPPASAEANKRDAERYRWLRQHARREALDNGYEGMYRMSVWANDDTPYSVNCGNAFHYESLDEAIDAAMITPLTGAKRMSTITKDEWIKRAEDELERLAPGWEKQALFDYADSLYDTYVTDGIIGYDNDPEGAVAEDMTYWD